MSKFKVIIKSIRAMFSYSGSTLKNRRLYFVDKKQAFQP